MAKTIKELKTTLDWAKAYIQFGLSVLPCYGVKPDGDCMCPPNSKERKRTEDGSCSSPGKHPFPKLVPNGSRSASNDLDQIEKWFGKDGEYNIAIATGKCRNGNNLMVTDLDIRKGKNGPATWDALKQEIGETFPSTLRQTTGSGGKQDLWWTEDEVPMSSETKLGPGIDVRGKSGYVVVPPSLNDLGPYRWENWQPVPQVIAGAPKALEDRARHGKPASPVTARAAAPKPDTDLPDDPNDTLMFAQLRELLKVIPPGPRDNWLMVGATIKTIANSKYAEESDWAILFNIWDAWAEEAPGYSGLTDQQKQWESFPPTLAPPIAVLRKLARDNGWAPSEEFRKQERTHWKDTAQKLFNALSDDADPDSDAAKALFRVLGKLPEMNQNVFIKEKLSKRFKSWGVKEIRSEVAKQRTHHATETDEPSDVGLLVAQRVLIDHYEKLLIRPADRFFWKYNGKHWEPIENGDDIVGDKCIDVIESLGPIRVAVSTAKRQAVDLLHSRCAREGDPLRLKSQPPAVINCLNGELWIQPDGTVKMQDHNPDSFLRFCLNINYDPEAKCPLFDEAVLEIFAKSPEPEDMRRHLYEMFGYAIQPKRDIKQFWMWDGNGDNGKTGLANTLQKMIGDAATFSIKLSKVDSDYNLSAIKQCLLVRDNDIDWKTVLPDGIVKQLSEDASLTGRDPYGKPTGFKNCSLPLLLCNKYPMTKDLSHGVQVRAHAIPFRRIFIKGKDMKRGLFERIWETELPGILNQAIEGLQRLRERGGYKEPEDCLRAKDQFLRQANPLPRFIAEACANDRTPLETIRRQARLAVLQQHFDEAETLLQFEELADGFESINELLKIAVAQAESERLRCKFTDFYKEFWQWARNEGIQMAHKPPRADVENYLINLGYAMTTVENQKWVDGVRPFPQFDERPSNAM